MIHTTIIKSPVYAPTLHLILDHAFRPFRDYYTQGAYESTVVSEDIFRERILSDEFTVYGAFHFDQLAGSVTTRITSDGALYFMTMAVDPTYAGQGIGKRLLHTIEEEAKNKNCSKILLETYEPLTYAIRLYEHNGFRATGNKRDYSGIEIFEMLKEI